MSELNNKTDPSRDDKVENRQDVPAVGASASRVAAVMGPPPPPKQEKRSWHKRLEEWTSVPRMHKVNSTYSRESTRHMTIDGVRFKDYIVGGKGQK